MVVIYLNKYGYGCYEFKLLFKILKEGIKFDIIVLGLLFFILWKIVLGVL